MRESVPLTQEKLADLLGVTREWIGKLETSERPISAKVYLGLRALASEGKFTPRAGGSYPDVTDFGAPLVAEASVAQGDEAAEKIRKECRRIFEQTMEYAGDDVRRLGWFHEQLLRHASVPEHWDIHAQVIAKKLRQSQEPAEAESSHGKAS